MSISILHSFRFDGGFIFEMKFNDLETTAEKKDVFQWTLIYGTRRYDLKFHSGAETQRIFTYEDGMIFLNMTEMKIMLGHRSCDFPPVFINEITHNISKYWFHPLIKGWVSCISKRKELRNNHQQELIYLYVHTFLQRGEVKISFV